MSWILEFNSLNMHSIPLVGGKNASLGEMINAGIRVPPGFAVTTGGYLHFITESGIGNEIFRILAEMNIGDIRAQEVASQQIQQLIRNAVMVQGIRAEIDSAYGKLCENCGVELLPVAVRSSATAEDLPTASFAGQQDSYLWVSGIDKIVGRVQDCWASLFTPRAIDYRIKNKFAHEQILISVGVQKMVNAKAAGVMFTLNPTDGDLSKMVIEGNWGLGETVVSGSVNPDKFVVDKVIMETTEKKISTKHIECVFDLERQEVVNAEIGPDMQCTCCLEEREVRELVKMGKIIEQHYGRPMDIEWAIDKDLGFPKNIFIVQARPETVWSRRQAQSLLGKKTGRQLLMEQAMKRIRIPH